MSNKYEIIKIIPYNDKRGSLKKVLKKSGLDLSETVEEVYVLYTEKGCVRGNHYHKQNIEYFCVIKGTATIALKPADSKNMELLKISCNDNLVIKVPAYVAHAFRNDEDEQLIILAIGLRQYDEGDKDTYSIILL